MGYSITSYIDKNIMSKDYKIEVWFRLICNEISNIPNIPEWLCEAQNYWLDHVDNYVNGCFDPKLDEFLTNSERVSLFIDLCQKVYEFLKSFGGNISKEYLNSIGNYQKPFEVIEDNSADLYITFGNALIRLLKGEQEKQTENA